MSLTSKITLCISVGVSAGIIGYVHYKQWADKHKLHEGVLKDIERQQRKKIENLYFLQQQIEMGKMLKKQEQDNDAVTLKFFERTKDNS